MMNTPLLSIDNLRSYFYSRSKQAFVRSVDGVSLRVLHGETVGVVGESGSGKSITALSVMGLLSGGPGVIGGCIRYSGSRVQRELLQDLEQFVTLTEENGSVMAVAKDERGWQRHSEKLMEGMRGREIGMIFQNPRSSLNPYLAVGEQIAEAILLHGRAQTGKEARELAIHWLEQVRIDSPHLRYNARPGGLSGGMCQRAMIAMALSSGPALLIADEPTTGLDATIQSKIVDLLQELKQATGISTLLISHDISVITRLSDHVVVLYGGTVVESGPASQVLDPHHEVKHPYTAALLASVPSEQRIRERARLQAIEGEVIDTINVPAGCRFQARCNRIMPGIRENCATRQPGLVEVTPGHQVRCWRIFEQGH